MAIVSCPECNKKLKVADTSIGKKVKCTCDTVFVAATEADAPAVSAPAATPEKVYVACSECGAKLKVATTSIGKKMKCPKCAGTFVARIEDAAPPVKKLAPVKPIDDDEEDAPPKPKIKAKAKAKKEADEDDLFSFAEDEAAGALGGMSDDDEDDVPSPKKKAKPMSADEDDDDDERPMPKSKKTLKPSARGGDDDEDDDDAQPAAKPATPPVYPSRLVPNLLVTLLVLLYGGAVAAVFFQMFDPAKELGLKEPKVRIGFKVDTKPLNKNPDEVDPEKRYRWQPAGIPQGMMGADGVFIKDIVKGAERFQEMGKAEGGKGSMPFLGNRVRLDVPGSRNVHIKIDPDAKTTAYAGLAIAWPCIAELLADGTLLVDSPNVMGKDAKGKVWQSAKCTLNDKEVMAFFPTDLAFETKPLPPEKDDKKKGDVNNKEKAKDKENPSIDITKSTRVTPIAIPAKGKSVPTFDLVLDLKVESVTAHETKYQDKLHWTYVPTFKVSKRAEAPASTASQDVWAWVIYVSGAPSPEEVGELMVSRLSWPMAPKGMTYSVDNTSARVDKKIFRSARTGFTVTFKEPSPQDAGKEVVMYSMLLAPELAKDRWSAVAPVEVTIPIDGFNFDKLMKTLTSQGKLPMLEERGVAAVCLVGFDEAAPRNSQMVVLSQPLVLSLNPKGSQSK